MNEISLTIPTDNNKIIYAKQNGDWAKTLVIYVHGLTSDMDELLPVEASKYFITHGISFLRFDLYSGRSGARTMSECDLDTHMRDLNHVIQYAKEQGASDIHLIGHSLGNYSLLMADLSSAATLILWDPSHPLRTSVTSKKLLYVKELDSYVMKAGVDYVFSNRYVYSVEQFNPSNYIQHIQTPTIILNAGDGVLIQTSEMYEKELRAHTEVCRITIENADHNFSTIQNKSDLFKESLAWIESHSN